MPGVARVIKRLAAIPPTSRLDHSSTRASHSTQGQSCLDLKLILPSKHISPSKLISHPDRIHFVSSIETGWSGHSSLPPQLSDGSGPWVSGSSPSLACVVFLAQCPLPLSFFLPLVLPQIPTDKYWCHTAKLQRPSYGYWHSYLWPM